jgi:hypothetical protein
LMFSSESPAKWLSWMTGSKTVLLHGLSECMQSNIRIMTDS